MVLIQDDLINHEDLEKILMDFVVFNTSCIETVNALTSLVFLILSKTIFNPLITFSLSFNSRNLSLYNLRRLEKSLSDIKILNGTSNTESSPGFVASTTHKPRPSISINSLFGGQVNYLY